MTKFKPTQNHRHVGLFVKANFPAVACTFAAGLLIALLFMPASVGELLLIGAANGGLLTVLLYKFIWKMQSRIAANGTVLWEVKVNGVKVGELSDAQVAQLQAATAADPEVHLRQLLNALLGALNVFGAVVRHIPLIAFWSVVTIILYNPEGLQDTAAKILTGQLALATWITLKMLAAISLMYVIAVPMLRGDSSVFGLANMFRADYLDRVRAHCQCPASGEVCIYPAYTGIMRQALLATAPQDR